MATEGIRITVSDAEIIGRLDQVDRVAENPAAIMASIAGYLVTATQRHIERETGEDGPWPKLSPRTAARRIGRKRRGTANMLRVSNRLYSSITGASTDREAMAGTNLIYAAIHQFGGEVKMPEREQDIHLRPGKGRRLFVKATAKRRETRRVKVGAHTVTIPARSYLYLDDADRAEILAIAADGLRAEAGLP